VPSSCHVARRPVAGTCLGARLALEQQCSHQPPWGHPGSSSPGYDGYELARRWPQGWSRARTAFLPLLEGFSISLDTRIQEKGIVVLTANCISSFCVVPRGRLSPENGYEHPKAGRPNCENQSFFVEKSSFLGCSASVPGLCHVAPFHKKPVAGTRCVALPALEQQCSHQPSFWGRPGSSWPGYDGHELARRGPQGRNRTRTGFLPFLHAIGSRFHLLDTRIQEKRRSGSYREIAIRHFASFPKGSFPP
jgi:hypothetical protein